MDTEDSSDPTYCRGMSGELEVIRKEMKSMRKQLKEKLKDSRSVTRCQFSDEILQNELPYNFKPLNYEYNGSTDPTSSW